MQTQNATMVEQLREWADQLETSPDYVQGIIAGLRDVANDLEEPREVAVKRSETKVGHTPGPWKATNNGHYWDIVAWDDDRPVPRWAPALASVHSWESEATARLIAAAPDLLEALKDLVGHCTLSSQRRVEAHDKALAYDKALAAIAKAEGEA